MALRFEEYVARLKQRKGHEYTWRVDLRGNHFFIKAYRGPDKELWFEARLDETGVMNLYRFEHRGKIYEVEFFI